MELYLILGELHHTHLYRTEINNAIFKKHTLDLSSQLILKIVYVLQSKFINLQNFQKKYHHYISVFLKSKDIIQVKTSNFALVTLEAP